MSEPIPEKHDRSNSFSARSPSQDIAEREDCAERMSASLAVNTSHLCIGISIYLSLVVLLHSVTPVRRASHEPLCAGQPNCFFNNHRQMKTIGPFVLFLLLSSQSFSQTKEELFEAGKSDFEKGWLITAVDRFSDAIKSDSNFAAAYYYRGLTYIKGALSDCYAPAVNDFYKCIALQPDSNFWQAYLYIAERKVFPETAALKYYDRAIEFNPTNYLLYQKRGFLKQWNRLFSPALTDYKKAIALNGADSHTYELKASIELQNGKYVEALADISKAIELKPDDAKLYFDKTEILCRLNQLKSARKNHKKAMQKAANAGEFITCSCCESVKKQN